MGCTDISADYAGSLEFTKIFTTIENPFLVYDPIKMELKEKITGMGPNDILFTSVDHLPAEMPVDASNHFGSKLLPYILDLVKSRIDVPFAEQVEHLPPEIYNAVMTCNGELTPNFKYVADLRAENEGKLSL